MPLKIPNLDDRTYTELLEEAVAMLPRHAPSWTNHNPSDPGITLIELLAYFTEQFIYRLNRVTKDTKISFLQLLSGPQLDAKGKARLGQAPLEEVDEAFRAAVLNLRRRERAVTPEDYEFLAMAAAAHNTDETKVLRARAVVRRNLHLPELVDRESEAPGHMTVVVLPTRDLAQNALDALLAQVRDYLEPRRLLTTRLHVVGAFYLRIEIGAVIHPRLDVSEQQWEDIRRKAIEKLRQYFTPWSGGGPEGTGWPFGRALYLSEVYQMLEQVEGVDYIDDVRVLRMSIAGEPEEDRSRIGIQVGLSRVDIDSRLGVEAEAGSGRLLRDLAGRLAVVSLRPYEVVRVDSRPEDIRIRGSFAAATPAETQDGAQ
jgi:hypothetical protein